MVRQTAGVLIIEGERDLDEHRGWRLAGQVAGFEPVTRDQLRVGLG